MSTNEKHNPYAAIKTDRHAAFVAEAMILRALHSYRDARERAKTYDHLDLSAYLKPPSYEDLGERYDKLLTEGAVEAPEAPHGVLAYIELASAIVAGVLAGRYQEEGGIVSLERDLGYTLELLSRARNWVNRLDLADCLARERDPVTALALERRRLQAEVKPIWEKFGKLLPSASDYDELQQAALALDGKIEAIELQMMVIVATSPAGIAEQIDTLREQVRSSDEPEREPMLDTIIAGVRTIAAKGGETQP